MSAKRQNNQMALAFTPAPPGEARMGVAEGTETLVATPDAERPASTAQWMEEVCERENLKRALRRGRGNKGSAGIDGTTVEQLPAFLNEHWPAIRAQLLNGTYRPQPVRRVEIPKPDGGTRTLGIPTALDRFLPQAVLQVLQRDWDGTFSEQSYGVRPHRSAHQAVARAQTYMAAGYRWVVDIDLEKFFDRVNHDRLMGRVAKRVTDQRLLTLLRACLNAGVMEHISTFITTRLTLTVNREKSAVARPAARTFLGFSVTAGPTPRRRIAPKAMTRFKARIRTLTRRTRGVSVEQMVRELATYLTGWRGYVGYCSGCLVSRRGRPLNFTEPPCADPHARWCDRDGW